MTANNMFTGWGRLATRTSEGDLACIPDNLIQLMKHVPEHDNVLWS